MNSKQNLLKNYPTYIVLFTCLFPSQRELLAHPFLLPPLQNTNNALNVISRIKNIFSCHLNWKKDYLLLPVFVYEPQLEETLTNSGPSSCFPSLSCPSDPNPCWHNPRHASLPNVSLLGVPWNEKRIINKYIKIEKYKCNKHETSLWYSKDLLQSSFKVRNAVAHSSLDFFFRPIDSFVIQG